MESPRKLKTKPKSERINKSARRIIDNDEIFMYMAIIVYIDFFSACTSFALTSWNLELFGFVSFLSSFHNVALFSFLLDLFLTKDDLRFGHYFDIIMWSIVTLTGPVNAAPPKKLILCNLRMAWRLPTAIRALQSRVEKKAAGLHRELKLSVESAKEMQTAMKCLDQTNKVEGKLRMQTERMIKSYKGKLETAKEALQIAAIDHASKFSSVDGEDEKTR